MATQPVIHIVRSIKEDVCLRIMEEYAVDDMAVCGRQNRVSCEICELDACDEICLRAMGCEHKAQRKVKA